MENSLKQTYDVIVVGGGIGGITAALSAARHGAKTALIHDRPMPGGNAGSEVRMHICGATCHGGRKDSRETGILEEILLENKKRNPNHVFPVFDTIMWEKLKFQENLTLYLNTHMYDVCRDGERIQSITAKQLTTEKTFEFTGKIYIDCTGDGTLSYLAGARYMTGREGRNVFGEKYAVPESDSVTMGNSILFAARDTGAPVSFTPPSYAHHYTEKDLMGHKEITSGYWWVEIGGTEWNTITEAEEIRDELLAIIYGIWDHIKNGGDHHAENYDLTWIGFLPGKRESRRIVGDYVLKEQDLLEGKRFPDAVAYGGWNIDTHMPEKFLSIAKGEEQTEDISIKLEDVYTIPYRCLYSADIANLMMGGRLISTSHRAFGSTRVMGTCASVSQAAGLAAALAAKDNLTPRQVGDRIGELQQLLLKDDCYIPGILRQDPADLAPLAQIHSDLPEDPLCRNVAFGYSRRVNGTDYAWESGYIPTKEHPAGLTFCWDKGMKISEIRLAFDSDLSAEIMPSLSDWAKDRQPEGVPKTIVKDFTIQGFYHGASVFEVNVEGNYQRHRIIDLDCAAVCDQVEIKVFAANGEEPARIYEVRIYE